MKTCTQVDQDAPDNGAGPSRFPDRRLVAQGTTRLSKIHELQRKYDHRVQKLCALDADVTVTSGSAD